MNKSSNAQQIKEACKELLSDYKKHSRKELFDFALKRSGYRFTDGMLTGALRTLVTDTEDYICISRGWYKKINVSDSTESSNSLIGAYVEILSDALKKSKNITSDPFKIMKMSLAEKNKMLDIEDCLNTIEKTLEKIQSSSSN